MAETSYTIKNLTAGKQYKFRVKAENAAGIGNPSKATNGIKAKEPFGKANVAFVLRLKQFVA